MGLSDVGRLSLPQWIAISSGWAKAHGGKKVEPPSEAEFDRAVMVVH